MSRAAGVSATRSTSRRTPSTHSRALGKTLSDYYFASEAPLTTLLFLLPMIVLYELGTIYYASDWSRQTETRVLAFNLLRNFLGVFGATARHLPCFAVVGILIAWHIARKDAWKPKIWAALGMVVESLLLALPLLALSNLVGYYVPLIGGEQAWKGGLVLALGAGIYEELLFRLMGFTLLNILFVDILKMGKRPALLLIVIITSIVFSAYHYWSPQSAAFRWSDCIFRTGAGVYFGLLFMARSFGITAGSHAAYDIYYFLFNAMAV